ncbi:MAG: ATP-binding cassette domain-containing protein [Candidatus Marinimicrobia bacterium]|nr:ATP-binding cassette domain-containing protein [Candidatus Neomarinimicrobiota bacterium]
MPNTATNAVLNFPPMLNSVQVAAKLSNPGRQHFELKKPPIFGGFLFVLSLFSSGKVFLSPPNSNGRGTMPQAEPVFLVENVSKRPPQKSSVGKYILRDITFRVHENEILTVLGPSGAGKSTLLRLLNALDDPDEGQIQFRGKDITEMDIFELRTKIGMVFQKPALLPGTVKDNLEYPYKVKNTTGTPDISYTELLNTVGLSNQLLSRDSTALSVGQQQRVMIARALVNQPKVLLMDEPTSALDPSASNKILKLTNDLQKEYGLTIIFVTHNIPKAKEIADRVLFLVDGELKNDTPAEDFFSGKTDALAQRFLSGSLGETESE